MFHRFEELGPGPTLVRSTEFDYGDPARPFSGVDDELLHEGSTRIGSFLCRATQFGHVRQEDGSYLTRSLPPVEFGYSKARISDEVREIDAGSLENLPSGAGGATRWVDLDGEGLPGLLTRQGGAWHYKPNLGGGRFGPSRSLHPQPSLAPAEGAERFMDLSGDGQLDLVEMSGPMRGFYERGTQGGWEGFRSFRKVPRHKCLSLLADALEMRYALTGDYNIEDIDEAIRRWKEALSIVPGHHPDHDPYRSRVAHAIQLRSDVTGQPTDEGDLYGTA